MAVACDESANVLKLPNTIPHLHPRRQTLTCFQPKVFWNWTFFLFFFLTKPLLPHPWKERTAVNKTTYMFPTFENKIIWAVVARTHAKPTQPPTAASLWLFFTEIHIRLSEGNLIIKLDGETQYVSWHFLFIYFFSYERLGTEKEGNSPVKSNVPHASIKLAARWSLDGLLGWKVHMQGNGRGGKANLNS